MESFRNSIFKEVKGDNLFISPVRLATFLKKSFLESSLRKTCTYSD
jgi:hypothetical protein